MAETIIEGLRVVDLELSFGGVLALDAVHLEVAPGTVHALIGPNGAGKTTLLNVLTGIYRPQRGAVSYGGRELLSMPVAGIARLGVGRTYQQPSLFPGMTVEENILVGCHRQTRSGLWRCGLRTRGARREEAASRAWVREVAGLLDLADVLAEPVSTQTHSTQKRVDLARALAMRPEILLMDEPASGMPSADRRDLASLIRGLVAEKGMTVVMVDHDMDLVERVSDHITVLHHGQVIESGTMSAIASSPVVIEAYLGSGLTGGQETGGHEVEGSR